MDFSGAMGSLLEMDQSEMGAKADWRRADEVNPTGVQRGPDPHLKTLFIHLSQGNYFIPFGLVKK